jgi:hypothetical protein
VRKIALTAFAAILIGSVFLYQLLHRLVGEGLFEEDGIIFDQADGLQRSAALASPAPHVGAGVGAPVLDVKGSWGG